MVPLVKECKKEVAISGGMGAGDKIERQSLQVVSMAVPLPFVLPDRASVLIWCV